MKIRKIVIGAAVVTVGVPVVLILIVVVSVAVLDRTNGTIVSSGKPRSYLLYVPRSHDRAKPTPLVISMHGAAGWPAQQMNLSRWNRLAESQGFFVVRSEEHTSELQSLAYLVCRLLLEKKKNNTNEKHARMDSD